MDVIEYRRVSTTEQGKSNLGLESQHATIEAFAAAHSLNIIAAFEEVETGKGYDALERRPVFAAAMALAKRRRCKIIVAKIDRLSRDNAYLASMLTSKGADFISCDTGLDADLTLMRMQAVFAEHERDMISKRTKSALAALKARGVKLGSPTPGNGAAVSAAHRRAAAVAFAQRVMPAIEGVRSRAPSATLQVIADELNRMGIPGSAKGPWSKMAVCNVLRRLENTEV